MKGSESFLVLAKRNIESAYEKEGHEVNNVALMSQEILLIDDMLDEKDVIEKCNSSEINM